MTRPNRPNEAAARRILQAVAALAAARVERDQAMTDALKAGASVREVAKVSGMTTTQTQKIGRENGWPTAAQKKRWADEKAEGDRIARMVEEFRQTREVPD